MSRNLATLRSDHRDVEVTAVRGALAAQRFGGRAVDMQAFDGKSASPKIVASLTDADALLVSAPPADGVDPVLAHSVAR